MPAISPSWQAHSINWLPDPLRRLTYKMIPIYKIMIREEQFVFLSSSSNSKIHLSKKAFTFDSNVLFCKILFILLVISDIDKQCYTTELWKPECAVHMKKHHLSLQCHIWGTISRRHCGFHEFFREIEVKCLILTEVFWYG